MILTYIFSYLTLLQAQEIPCDKTKLCLKQVTAPRVEMTAPSVPFFKVARGTFCTTPQKTSKGSLITACSNGTIYFLNSTTGKPLAQPKPIRFNYDKEIYTGDISLIEVPNSNSKKFVAVMQSTGEVAIVSDLGTKQTIANFDDGASYPALLNDQNIVMNVGLQNTAAILNINTKSIKNIQYPKSSYGGTATTIQTNSGGKVLFTGDNGNLEIFSEDGTKKSVTVSNSPLSTASISPDNKVWITDSKGKLYIYDPNTDTKKYLELDLGEFNAIPTMDKRCSTIVFFKNGNTALNFGENVYIYSKEHKLLNVFDRKKTFESVTDAEYQKDPTLTTGAPMGDPKLITLPTADEGIWIPSHGSHYILNSNGEVIASYAQPKQDDLSAEMLSTPSKIENGTFTLGMFYGVEKFKLSNGTRTMKSSVWGTCGK